MATLANQIFLKKFFQKFLKFSEVFKFVSKNFLFFQKSMVFQKFFFRSLYFELNSSDFLFFQKFKMWEKNFWKN